jgi:hypothetical protein
MRFLLVHGGWQGGWCWDGVAERLRAAGHEVLAPTLAGHEPGATGRTDLTATELARRLADDVAVDRSVYQACAGQLGQPATATAPGAYEAMLSQPSPLADALLEVCQ